MNKVLPYLQRCNEVLVNIGEALMQGQLLQEAFACEKPEPWIVAPNESVNARSQKIKTVIIINERGKKGRITLCQG